MILKAVKDSMIIMIMTSSLGGSRQIEPPKSVQGPIARGPTVRGPIVRGPIRLEP